MEPAPHPPAGIVERLTQAQAHHRALDLVRWARARSPLLDHHWRGWHPDHDDWQALPVTDKAQLMSGFDDWVTDRAVKRADVQAFMADPRRAGCDYLGRYAVWSSSGTSGQPGIFLHDGAALATYGVLTTWRMQPQLLARCLWPGTLPTLAPARAALVAALDGHYAGISYWRRQLRLYPWLAERSLELSVTDPIELTCERLTAFAPTFLASYPSMLVELAERQRRGRLHIRPSMLWAGGEPFSAAQRRYCEDTFGALAANDYGCSEALSIAIECRCGRLHLHDDWVRLEPVDADDRPVPAGRWSHSALLTNLANRVAPIVRYRLGDSVRLDTEPCACGNPHPTLQVQGRCDDVLQLDGGSAGMVTLSPLALTSALEEQAGVYRFQLVQTGPRAVELRLEASERVHAARARSVLLRYLRERGLPRVSVQASAEPPVVEASGKLRRVRLAATGAARAVRA